MQGGKQIRTTQVENGEPVRETFPRVQENLRGQEANSVMSSSRARTQRPPRYSAPTTHRRCPRNPGRGRGPQGRTGNRPQKANAALQTSDEQSKRYTSANDKKGHPLIAEAEAASLENKRTIRPKRHNQDEIVEQSRCSDEEERLWT